MRSQGFVTLPLQDVKILLEDFGLALPLTQPYSKDECPSFDLNTLSAISLPLVSTGSSPDTTSFPSTSLEANSDYGSIQGVVKFSKQAFAISPSADHRLKYFLPFFRLQAKSDKMETIHPPHQVRPETPIPQVTESKTDKKKGSDATRKAAHKAVCCEEPDVEPHWHMWTVSHCY